MRAAIIPRLVVPILTWSAVFAVAAGDSDKAQSAFRAGNRLLDNAHFAEAAQMYSRALEQDPRSTKVYYNRALANEMVDRQAAIGDWKQFLELAGKDPQWKQATAQVRERLAALEKMPALPDSLQLPRYLPKSGDYYQEVAEKSQGLQFRNFPVKVFVGSVPEGWQRSTREALDDWSHVVPLQQVASREAADIVLSWRTSPDESGHLAWEKDLIHEEDDGMTARSSKIAVVTLDTSRHLSGAQQRAAILHEIGHALGIRGHSSTSGDVMYGAIDVVVVHETRIVAGFPAEGGRLPGVTSQSFLPTPPKNLTQRDVNTLIRLYNSPGPLPRLED